MFPKIHGALWYLKVMHLFQKQEKIIIKDPIFHSKNSKNKGIILNFRRNPIVVLIGLTFNCKDLLES